MGVKSIIAIPEPEWHLDYVTPRPYCLSRNGRCEPTAFTTALDSKKVCNEFMWFLIGKRLF